ncbi:restriction endonuclease subunit S [Anaeromusa sp.]|uniref:restriction endonuclease subunit S n=1 Tax=Anaeromusa sp. TaxID=1872520 RepID=UPI002634E964|nr:restriction endonuclease subunit S [Anaeromusa sp.]MDD3158578.1 restriction endonuclease subunit S [Anaeromusa sp.]
MSKLEDLLKELCPDGVEYKAINDCVDDVKKIKWSATESEKYQYIDLTSVDRDTHLIAETQVIDKNNAPSRAQQIVNEGDVLLGATRPLLKRYCMINDDYDKQVCSTGFCVLRAKSNIVLRRWLYHLISSAAFFAHVEKFQKGASYPAISDADVKAYVIPIPPLPVQNEIVRILDNFTELTAELKLQLTEELAARKKQYDYYASKLIMGHNGGEEYEKVLLGDIADFTYGFTDKARESGTARFIRITDIGDNGYLKQVDAKYIELTEASRKYLLKAGNLLMARTGATYGKTLYMPNNEPSVYASFLIKITLQQNKLLNKFYWHFTRTQYYWEQANKLVSAGGQPQFNTGAISRVMVPVPPLEEQQRIVAILDRFDTLCNDISAGLPAEIAARTKQYEYYRDKLLTFPERT